MPDLNLKRRVTVNLNPVRRSRTTDMLPRPVGAYATIQRVSTTRLTRSRYTAFGKEPGKTQQRHGEFAVDEPFSYSDFSLHPRGTTGRRTHYVHASTSL